MTVHDVPCWIDLSTPEIDAATRFYRDLFGWSIEEMDTPMGAYFVGRLGEHDVGGMMLQRPELEGLPASWTVYFSVEHLDESVERVIGAGGSVIQPVFEVPGGDRIAVVADPTGAVFGLLSGSGLDAAWLTRHPGAVCWVELLSRDTTVAEGFYATVFGWKTITEFNDDTAYTMLQSDGLDVAGMMEMPHEVPAEAPSHWAVYFAVTDCHASVQRVVDLGGEILRPTSEIDHGQFAILADPEGAPFHLLEFAAEE